MHGIGYKNCPLLPFHMKQMSGDYSCEMCPVLEELWIRARLDCKRQDMKEEVYDGNSRFLFFSASTMVDEDPPPIHNAEFLHVRKLLLKSPVVV